LLDPAILWHAGQTLPRMRFSDKLKIVYNPGEAVPFIFDSEHLT
jgi:hypothetical protein